MSAEHVAALKAAAICRTLSDAEIGVLAAIAERQEVAAQTELFREGDASDGLYLVVAGEIDIVKRSGGTEHPIARLGAGEVLGEISLLTSDSRSATGRAVIATSVLRLPAARFRKLLGENSPAALKLATAIAEVLARRLAATNDKMLELSARVGPDRATSTDLRNEELAELHRTLKVWSF